MQRIKKGDKVRIISGKLSTKEGTVLSVNPRNNTAIVEGLNKVKVHKKASGKQEKGGIFEIEQPIYLSKIALLAPKAPQGISKIKYTKNKEGHKIRVAKKTNQEIVSSKSKINTPVGDK
ncbi:MAG: 50S ribosomal protein L24 [Mycoplasmataceae bacterium]|jgi:large subunit ribosomal protein L24|nr:50S ribosomal protein L24 [Mycoplasmataceae bacterium]